MKKITYTAFVNEVDKKRVGNEFISVTTITEPKMLVRNNPFIGRVKKVNKQTYMFGSTYKNRVNNELVRNGLEKREIFGGLPFGHWEVDNKIITHNGQFYIRLYPVNGLAKKTNYFIDGVMATQEEVKELKSFMRKSKSDVKVIDYKLSNVKEITMNKEKYIFQ